MEQILHRKTTNFWLNLDLLSTLIGITMSVLKESVTRIYYGRNFKQTYPPFISLNEGDTDCPPLAGVKGVGSVTIMCRSKSTLRNFKVAVAKLRL